MDGDSVIMGALADGSIEVDGETGSIYSRRIRGHVGERVKLDGACCNGYIVHNLSYKSVKRQIRAHRVVWMSAHGRIPDDLVIDHINRNKMDNRLANLRLATLQENAANSPLRTGEDNPVSKVTMEQVRQIRELYRVGMSCREIAADFGISKSQVHNIVTGRSWLDGHRWPAGPGEAQHTGEAPRTITTRLPNRAARLKALGNAIVPQQAAVLMAAIAHLTSTSHLPHPYQRALAGHFSPSLMGR